MSKIDKFDFFVVIMVLITAILVVLAIHDFEKNGITWCVNDSCTNFKIQ